MPGEVASLNDFLDHAEFFSSATLISSSHTVTVAVTKRLPDRVGSEFLQCCVGIQGLVYERRYRAVAEASLVITSFRIAANGFALGEPLPADFCQQPGRLSLVRAMIARVDQR